MRKTLFILVILVATSMLLLIPYGVVLKINHGAGGSEVLLTCSALSMLLILLVVLWARSKRATQ